MRHEIIAHPLRFRAYGRFGLGAVIDVVRQARRGKQSKNDDGRVAVMDDGTLSQSAVPKTAEGGFHGLC